MCGSFAISPIRIRLRACSFRGMDARSLGIWPCIIMNGTLGWLKTVFIGRSRELSDHNLFHRISLIALFAWVGLGADGLSSSCYGPEEAFRTLGQYQHLSVFVALAAVLTIAAICASYSQIIELFPTGGGGYLVASKLLSRPPVSSLAARC